MSGRIVDFSIVKMGSLHILLDDGSTLVCQLVPIRVTDIGEKTPEGIPLYSVNFQQTMDYRPPEGKIVPEAMKKEV